MDKRHIAAIVLWPGYGLDGKGFESFEEQELLQNAQTCFGAHQVFDSVDTGFFFSGGKVAEAWG
jgi:hypothetical protein